MNRIAIFLQDLRGGGAEKMMVRLANAIAERDFAVDLVLAMQRGVYFDLVSDKVRVVELNRSRTLASVLPLARYLRRERPLAMLSALTHVNIAAILAKLASRTGTRLMVSERSHFSRDRTVNPAASIRLAYAMAARLYRNADVVAAVSQSSADDLAAETGLPRSRIQVLGNPVVTRDLFECARENPHHPWLGEGQPPLILAVGRLAPEKDLQTLLRAFALLRRSLEARLLILGEGPERPALEALTGELGLGKDVSLPGFAVNPYAFMARASVLALPSLWEGSPNVLVEAMALGAPVVAVDGLGGAREVLQDGRCGALVPVGDAKALACALAETIAHPTPRGILTEGASRYTAEAAAAAYLAALLGTSPQ